MTPVSLFQNVSVSPFPPTLPKQSAHYPERPGLPQAPSAFPQGVIPEWEQLGTRPESRSSVFGFPVTRLSPRNGARSGPLPTPWPSGNVPTSLSASRLASSLNFRVLCLCRSRGCLARRSDAHGRGINVSGRTTHQYDSHIVTAHSRRRSGTPVTRPNFDARCDELVVISPCTRPGALRSVSASPV